MQWTNSCYCSDCSGKSISDVSSLHVKCLARESYCHILYKHVGCEEVLQSVDTTARNSVEWITHGTFVRIQFVANATEACSISAGSISRLIDLKFKKSGNLKQRNMVRQGKVLHNNTKLSVYEAHIGFQNTWRHKQ